MSYHKVTLITDKCWFSYLIRRGRTQMLGQFLRTKKYSEPVLIKVILLLLLTFLPLAHRQNPCLQKFKTLQIQTLPLLHLHPCIPPLPLQAFFQPFCWRYIELKHLVFSLTFCIGYFSEYPEVHGSWSLHFQCHLRFGHPDSLKSKKLAFLPKCLLFWDREWFLSGKHPQGRGKELRQVNGCSQYQRPHHQSTTNLVHPQLWGRMLHLAHHFHLHLGLQYECHGQNIGRS